MRPWVSLALAASVATAGAAAVAATPPPPPMASGEECDAYIANNISWPAVEDKCGCAIAIGPSSIVPYMKWHYCDLACVPGISFFLCAAWLLFLFSIVASTADEYLVPNLERLSDMLQLSPNVAGVSLLALGNGAPDFFTSFASFTQGTGDIGIGSLLGGGLFITSLVFGSVMIVAPFKSHRRPLLRDSGFYLVAVLMLAGFCVDGRVTAGEAISLVIWYGVYVVVVVVGRVVHKRRQREAAGARPPLLHGDSLLEDEDERENAMRLRRRRRDLRVGTEGHSGVVQAVCRLGADPDRPDGTPPAKPSVEAVFGYAWAWKDHQLRLSAEGDTDADASRPLGGAAHQPNLASMATLPSLPIVTARGAGSSALGGAGGSGSVLSSSPVDDRGGPGSNYSFMADYEDSGPDSDPALGGAAAVRGMACARAQAQGAAAARHRVGREGDALAPRLPVRAALRRRA